MLYLQKVSIHTDFLCKQMKYFALGMWLGMCTEKLEMETK